VAPHWGTVRPFGIPRAEDFRPGLPPALTAPEYAAGLNEVKRLGSADSTERTPDQTQIAEFWSDYPGATASPVGKWNLIAQTLGVQQGNTLAENARMFALLNMSLADAGIVCWDTKYTHGLWRPIDAIRLADTDGNPATLADPDWTPLLPTPAFPEYCQDTAPSARPAEILPLFFGTDDIAEIEAGFGVLPGVTLLRQLRKPRRRGGAGSTADPHEFSSLPGCNAYEIGDYVFANDAQAIPAPGAAFLGFLGAACWLRWRRTVR
jgi:hypothetical protein